jgi:hypothetical protein
MNLADWKRMYEPRLGHPMFETREMIDARRAALIPQQKGNADGNQ